MISIHELVTRGLLLVALTIFIVGADSRAIDDSGTIEKDVQHHLALYKRQADDSAPNVPEKHHRSQKQSPSPTPKAAHGESDKASTKKRDKAEKPKDKDKTTTKKPKQQHSASEKEHGSGGGSTKKPVKKVEKQKDEEDKEEKSKDEDKSDGDGDKKKKRTGKSTTQKPAASRKRNMKAEEKLKVANERWLQNQEVVAIEHMLAGVYDWMKVLKQTGGKTYNKKTAGELFEKVNNELAGMLSEQNKPKKLVAYYRQMKIK